MQCKQMISNTVKFWQRNNYYEHFSFLVNPIYVLVFNASLSNLTPMVQLFVEHASNFCFKITVLIHFSSHHV